MYKVFHENRCLVLNQTEIDSSVNRSNSLWKFCVDEIYYWLRFKETPNDLNLNTYSIPPLDLLMSVFSWRKAAGGVLFYKNALVVIERNGIPDLPKGHVEKGEHEKEAAVREVVEETGLQSIQLMDKLEDSWHCYWWNDQWVLKQTAWYSMNLTGEYLPDPQLEEGVTSVKLIHPSQLDDFLKQTYRSIRETLGSQIAALLLRVDKYFSE